MRVSLAQAILEGRTRHMRRINAHCRAGATKEVIPLALVLVPGPFSYTANIYIENTIKLPIVV